MESSRLVSAEYWESPELDLRLNPRRLPDCAGLLEFLSGELGIERSVVLATSGSTGQVKFVVLSKAALLASADSVAAYLGLSGDDSWLASLSGFHVGGLGIYARGLVTGAAVTEFHSSPWDRNGLGFREALDQSGARWTSLTPTHLHDLVEHRVKAPGTLRGLLLGGGRIDPDLVEKALNLGWPVRASFGMTEAGSQIATGEPGEPTWLDVLPGWETALTADKRLKIRGKALFTGYVIRHDNGWRFDQARDDAGWFLTGDYGELTEDRFRHLGRADDLVKVLGELVSVSQVEACLSNLLDQEVAVCAIPESRRGHELVVVMNGADDTRPSVGQINRELSGLEQVARIVVVPELPRTEIGKIDRKAFRDLINPS